MFVFLLSSSTSPVSLLFLSFSGVFACLQFSLLTPLLAQLLYFIFCLHNCFLLVSFFTSFCLLPSCNIYLTLCMKPTLSLCFFLSSLSTTCLFFHCVLSSILNSTSAVCPILSYLFSKILFKLVFFSLFIFSDFHLGISFLTI